jgi:hypothetical protein
MKLYLETFIISVANLEEALAILRGYNVAEEGVVDRQT